jgi:hypothetical protein
MPNEGGQLQTTVEETDNLFVVRFPLAALRRRAAPRGRQGHQRGKIDVTSLYNLVRPQQQRLGDREAERLGDTERRRIEDERLSEASAAAFALRSRRSPPC